MMQTPYDTVRYRTYWTVGFRIIAAHQGRQRAQRKVYVLSATFQHVPIARVDDDNACIPMALKLQTKEDVGYPGHGKSRGWDAAPPIVGQ